MVVNKRNERFEKRMAAAKAQRELVQKNLSGLEALRKTKLEEIKLAEKALADALTALQANLKNAATRGDLVRVAEEAAADLADIQAEYGPWAARMMASYQRQLAIQQVDFSTQVSTLHETVPLRKQGAAASLRLGISQTAQGIRNLSLAKPVEALMAKMPQPAPAKPQPAKMATAQERARTRGNAVSAWISNVASRFYTSEAAAVGKLKALQAGIAPAAAQVSQGDAALAQTLTLLVTEFKATDKALQTMEANAPAHSLTNAPAASLGRRAKVVATAVAKRLGLRTWEEAKNFQKTRIKASNIAHSLKQTDKQEGRISQLRTAAMAWLNERAEAKQAAQTAPERAEPTLAGGSANNQPIKSGLPAVIEVEKPARTVDDYIIAEEPTAVAQPTEQQIHLAAKARSLLSINRDGLEALLTKTFQKQFNGKLDDVQLKGLVKYTLEKANTLLVGENVSAFAKESESLQIAVKAAVDEVLAELYAPQSKAVPEASVAQNAAYSPSAGAVLNPATAHKLHREKPANGLMDRINSAKAAHEDSDVSLIAARFAPANSPFRKQRDEEAAPIAAPQADDTGLAIPEDEKPRIFRNQQPEQKPASRITPVKAVGFSALVGALGAMAFGYFTGEKTPSVGIKQQASASTPLVPLARASVGSGNKAAAEMAAKFNDEKPTDLSRYKNISQAAYQKLSDEEKEMLGEGDAAARGEAVKISQQHDTLAGKRLTLDEYEKQNAAAKQQEWKMFEKPATLINEKQVKTIVVPGLSSLKKDDGTGRS